MLLIASTSAQTQKDNRACTTSTERPAIENNKVRISRIVVEPKRLNEYIAHLKEEIEESMRLEPGVLTYWENIEKNKAL